MKKSLELTKAEEQIMLILWKKGSAFVRDILSDFGKIKPAYNTVSTIVRILETKGFVKHKTMGKSHAYFPAVSREQYLDESIRLLISNYFQSSPDELVEYLGSKKLISSSSAKEKSFEKNPTEELPREKKDTKIEKGKKGKKNKKDKKKKKTDSEKKEKAKKKGKKSGKKKKKK